MYFLYILFSFLCSPSAALPWSIHWDGVFTRHVYSRSGVGSHDVGDSSSDRIQRLLIPYAAIYRYYFDRIMQPAFAIRGWLHHPCVKTCLLSVNRCPYPDFDLRLAIFCKLTRCRAGICVYTRHNNERPTSSCYQNTTQHLTAIIYVYFCSTRI